MKPLSPPNTQNFQNETIVTVPGDKFQIMLKNGSMVNFEQTDDGLKVTLAAGNFFDLVLRDGTVLNVEQTWDDFSVTKADGVEAYSRPVSDTAKHTDGWKNDQPPVDSVVSGKN
jgi:hypothetical protein